jgi:hypothetical protein
VPENSQSARISLLVQDPFVARKLTVDEIEVPFEEMTIEMIGVKKEVTKEAGVVGGCHHEGNQGSHDSCEF